MKFGLDAPSLAAQVAAGVKPDYATFWVGPWTLTSGWGGPGADLDAMRAAGVTPAIHFYYWGDDISQDCLENGCWSTLHGAWKDKAGWNRLADELIAALDQHMGGEPVLVFVETEFNKGDLQTYEPLDGDLADMATHLRAGYPAAKVVLALGNWNPDAWTTWDRAAAASDDVGIQGMRGSTHETGAAYSDLYNATLRGAQRAQQLFGRPVILQDIALSSYPEPEYVGLQAAEWQRFFDGLPALRAAGVEALLARAWLDDPNMDLGNYYGEAERHWGFVDSRTDEEKPSAEIWIDGVTRERARGTAPSLPAVVSDLNLSVAQFATESTGVPLPDANATHGTAWALWTNGYAEQGFQLPAGSYDLAVRARGTSLGGVGPSLAVTVDGQPALVAEPTTAFSEFHARVAVAGTVVLRIAFTNDALSASEDRNLILDQVAWTPANDIAAGEAPAPIRVESSAPPTPEKTADAPRGSSGAALGLGVLALVSGGVVALRHRR